MRSTEARDTEVRTISQHPSALLQFGDIASGRGVGDDPMYIMGQLGDHLLQLLGQVLFSPDPVEVNSLTGGIGEQRKRVGDYVGPVSPEILTLYDSFRRTKQDGLGDKAFKIRGVDNRLITFTQPDHVV